MKKDTPYNENELEKDPVWDLLEQSPRKDASDMFARNVVRAVRLEQPEVSTPWYKAIFAPKPLAYAGGFAAIAIACSMIFMQGVEPVQSVAKDNPSPADNTAVVNSEMAELDNAMSEELLVLAADDPSLFSENELVSLIGL